MGDLSAFLPPEDASNLRDQQQQRQQRQKKPAKPAPRQRPDDWKMLTWQERRQQARAEKDKAEAAVLAEGLAAPIPPTNIGFKLLQKMGFKGPPAAQQMGGKAGFPSAGRIGMAETAGERHRGEGAREGDESGVTGGREKGGERVKAESAREEAAGERERALRSKLGSSWLHEGRAGEYCSGERPAANTREASIEDNREESVPAPTPSRKPLVWVEPVALSLKRDRKGLGREEEEEEAERQKLLRAEAAARKRRRGEEALRGEFEERRKGRWSDWKVRGALRKARTALVHLEGGEEWLRRQAVRIGAASSSSSSSGASAPAAPSGGAQLDRAGDAGRGRGGGGGGATMCGGAGGMESGAGVERGRDRRRRVRKKRIVTECDADGVSDEEWEEVEERRGEVAGGEENGEGGEGGEAGELLLLALHQLRHTHFYCAHCDVTSPTSLPSFALLPPISCSPPSLCHPSQLLLLALQRLRHKHFYCIHCGCQYESEDALVSMCPGEDEEAH
ncbi:unnamed protein product [Closterium sp. NIES-53]